MIAVLILMAHGTQAHRPDDRAECLPWCRLNHGPAALENPSREARAMQEVHLMPERRTALKIQHRIDHRGRLEETQRRIGSALAKAGQARREMHTNE